jgi:hypothetical protein
LAILQFGQGAKLAVALRVCRAFRVLAASSSNEAPPATEIVVRFFSGVMPLTDRDESTRYSIER